jgi:hypothetical protein
MTDLPGVRLVWASFVGTAAFVVAAVVGTVWLDLVAVLVFVSIALFFIGTGAFLLAYAKAVSRSRYETIGMGGLFFLAGTAPRRVQVLLLGSFAVEVAVALITASIRVYTPVAFGLLTPMFGLGLVGLWGAIYGEFPPREPAANVG